MNVASKVFLARGVGRHKEKLTSFEMALRDAGIAQFNIVTVSSIFPPKCRLIGRREGLTLLAPGEFVHAVMSKQDTNEPHRLIAASVGLAIPKDEAHYGYLSEHHSFGETDEKAGDYAEDLAAEMLATILGVPFDTELNWDERQEIWKISDEIVRTQNVTQSAIGDKNGLWTTVIAAAVLVP